MQVAALPRKKVRKYRCPFQGVYPEASFVQKGWGTALRKERAERKRKSDGEEIAPSAPGSLKSLRFIPFTRPRRAFIRLPTNQLRITFDLGPLHRHRRRHPSLSPLLRIRKLPRWKFPPSRLSQSSLCTFASFRYDTLDTLHHSFA